MTDSKRFDALVQQFQSTPSRRRLLGSLAIGLLADSLGHTPTRTAAERPKPYVGGSCKPKGRKCPPGSFCTGRSRRKRCVCLPGLALCGTRNTKWAACHDLLTTPSHCGFCENTCFAVADNTCQAGRCCTIDGGECSPECRPEAACASCCSGACRPDSTCGQLTTCVIRGTPCPGGCTAGSPCPACCEAFCNLSGQCDTGS